MSHICLLCKENETPDSHCKICEPCYDSAGTLLENNAELYAAAPSHHEALKRMVAAIEDALDDESLQITSECGDLLLQIASIGNAAIAEAKGR